MNFVPSWPNWDCSFFAGEGFFEAFARFIEFFEILNLSDGVPPRGSPLRATCLPAGRPPEEKRCKSSLSEEREMEDRFTSVVMFLLTTMFVAVVLTVTVWAAAFLAWMVMAIAIMVGYIVTSIWF
ncbi:hypothetical protein A2368_01440 [Candidatus Collierbacteria bacterium RIFOXYB1_FULL_49_13]|uniref:Uncharacterized protein n=1 Tax=Candidatus Collierbacteria bacterium RIFOXYB1_FULL_49_13 TaxID=1817728 RepID=A0A1F5FFX5_9BACT|nr:MAG: hypothetical protein A2368_01440 [Candidatus Collierbacteria bacterium RIFOXYB1_FULL_49_13]